MQTPIKLHHFFYRNSTKAQLHAVNTFYFSKHHYGDHFSNLVYDKKGAKMI